MFMSIITASLRKPNTLVCPCWTQDHGAAHRHPMVFNKSGPTPIDVVLFHQCSHGISCVPCASMFCGHLLAVLRQIHYVMLKLCSDTMPSTGITGQQHCLISQSGNTTRHTGGLFRLFPFPE